jgi:hypothetical protein
MDNIAAVYSISLEFSDSFEPSTVLLHHFDGVQPAYGPQFEADGSPIFTASGALFSKAYDPNRAASTSGCLHSKDPSAAFDLQADFTIEVSVLMRSATENAMIWIQNPDRGGIHNSGDGMEYVLGLGADGRCSMSFPTDSYSNSMLYSPASVPLGTYARIAYQRRGNSYTLFSGGAPQTTSSNSYRRPAGPKYLSVGRPGPYSYAAIDGLYAELRVSNRALYPEAGYIVAAGPFPNIV